MRPSGFKHPDETKERIATGLAGKTKTEEHRAKIAASVARARREQADRREQEQAQRKAELAHKRSLQGSFDWAIDSPPEPPSEASVQRPPRQLSEETKEKIAISMTGKTKSDETKQKIARSVSASLTGKTKSDETKEKIAASLAGKPKSEEHRAKIAASVAKTRWEKAQQKRAAALDRAIKVSS